MNQISEFADITGESLPYIKMDYNRTIAEVESVLLNNSFSNDSVENDQEMVVNEELFQ